MDISLLQSLSTELKERIDVLVSSIDIPAQQKTLQELEQQMAKSGFWDNPQKAAKIAERVGLLRQNIATINKTQTNIQDILDLLQEATKQDIAVLSHELQQIQKDAEALEIAQLYTEEYDHNNAIVTLQVGNGGQDAEDFCAMLERMIIRYSEAQKYTIQILDESHTDDGLRSAILSITGTRAYGNLKALHGIHRLIRMSPFNAKGLRQTSFARIEVLPEIPEHTFTLNDNDIRIDVFRSSGPGGQSVNTTDSAVRITYIPLGLTVTCQNEKSQLQNKAAAMQVLMAKLEQMRAEEQAESLAELRGEYKENSFGSQSITYTLQPYTLIKDHRTGWESNQPERALNGDLQPLILFYLQS